jgi:hypothetical protein
MPQEALFLSLLELCTGTGLPDFSWYNINSQMGDNVPNDHKLQNGHKKYQIDVCNIFHLAIKFTNIFHSKPSKIYPQNWDFGHENNHLATLVVRLRNRR